MKFEALPDDCRPNILGPIPGEVKFEWGHPRNAEYLVGTVAPPTILEPALLYIIFVYVGCSTFTCAHLMLLHITCFQLELGSNEI